MKVFYRNCFREQLGTNPRLKDVKAIKKGAALPFLTNAFVSKGLNRVPFLPRDKQANRSKSPPAKKAKKPGPVSLTNMDAAEMDDMFNISLSQPTALPSYVATLPIVGMNPSTSKVCFLILCFRLHHCLGSENFRFFCNRDFCGLPHL